MFLVSIIILSTSIYIPYISFSSLEAILSKSVVCRYIEAIGLSDNYARRTNTKSLR